MKKYIFIIILSIIAPIYAVAQQHSLTWDKFNLAGPPGLRQIGQLATRHSKDIPSSPWSVGCETLDRDYGKFANYKKYVGELGVKSARLQSGWAKCEQQKGQYTFEWLDECVYGLNEQGVKPWICLCYGNPIYGAEKDLAAKIFSDEVSMSAWLRYVEATVKRYRDVVNEWEIWNEPNFGGDNPRNSPAVYASLLMKTADKIKEIQPNAIIIGLGLGCPTKSSIPWAKEVFEILKTNNKANIMDYVTYHPYSTLPEGDNHDIAELLAMARSYCPEIKLFQGEVGCPAILEWVGAMTHYEWTEYSQAKWNLRQMVNNWAQGIRHNVFTMVDLQYPHKLQTFGLLRTNLLKEVVYKRPLYFAVQHVANVLDGSVSSTGFLDYTASTFRSISVVGIKNDQLCGVLLWYDDRVPSDDLKRDLVDITIKDIVFRDPVYVELITGKVYAIPRSTRRTIGHDTKFQDLPLWDSPVMVVERSQIKMK